ncbi:hypothetical protein HMPREF1487_09370 [Pseudomonas sp. HPB0071]|nr:hypothetical protein HMPREF1487_09370 [Pseudomonas sp. HPB0071]
MTTSTEKSYFDLHITGLGYLNRIREVKPKKGDAFLACDIAALNGPSDDVSYVRFDTRVSGSEAQHLVRRCIQAVDAERKVMIGFRLGDLWTDTFTYSKGRRGPRLHIRRWWRGSAWRPGRGGVRLKRCDRSGFEATLWCSPIRSRSGCGWSR